jgi:transcription elongation factor Elf1
MRDEVVISCPACLRQYVFVRQSPAKIGRCKACRCTFRIAVPELTDGDPCITFDDEILPRYQSFREGCAEMANDGRVFVGDFERLISRLPERQPTLGDQYWLTSFCGFSLIEARRRAPFEVLRRIEELEEYFAYRVPAMSPEVRRLLRDAFMGVLEIASPTDLLARGTPSYFKKLPAELVVFPCPECGYRFSVDSTFAGRRARCKGCGGSVKVPHPSEATTAVS